MLAERTETSQRSILFFTSSYFKCFKGPPRSIDKFWATFESKTRNNLTFLTVPPLKIGATVINGAQRLRNRKIKGQIRPQHVLVNDVVGSFRGGF